MIWAYMKIISFAYSWILIKMSKNEEKQVKNYIHCKDLDRL